MCTPIRHVGLGIDDPVFNAPLAFHSSQLSTSMLTEAIKSGSKVDLDTYEVQSKARKQQSRASKNIKLQELIDEILQFLPEKQNAAITRKINSKCSTWLTIVPTQENGFAMNGNEFRDAIAIQYGRTPSKLPLLCDADGEEFSVCHALNCRKGGLVSYRHNELRDLNLQLAKSAGFNMCMNEPIIRETDIHGEGGLRADWSVRGFWEHQIEALFDCRIINADAISYENKPLHSIFESHRNEKKRLYSAAVEDRRGTFTAFIATCDAILDTEAEHYVKRLSSYMAEKWGKSYSQVTGWVRAKIQICILCSVSLCLRSRKKWVSSLIEDGAAMTRFEEC